MLGTIKDVAKGIYGIPKIVHAKVSLVNIKSIIITHLSHIRLYELDKIDTYDFQNVCKAIME